MENLTSAELVVAMIDGHGWTRRLARKHKSALMRRDRFLDRHGLDMPPSFASTKAEKRIQKKAFMLWRDADKARMRLEKFCRKLTMRYGAKYGVSDVKVGSIRMRQALRG